MLDILLVEEGAKKTTVAALEATGHRVTRAATVERACHLLGRKAFEVVICDATPGLGDGMAVLRRARELAPATDVILMARSSSLAAAVAALKEGAYDYVLKPFDLATMQPRLERIVERRALAAELAAARASASRQTETPIVGRTPVMLRLADRIGTMAGSDAPVLITGETGTGKELVARNLHERSPRAAKPFVALNCAAFPEALLEAELFGHERGAFTGASGRREGRLKAAHGGTLFLDEVGELPSAAQVKLLRVLQDGVFEPLGTNKSTRVDVRLITATHRDLKERIARGLFREDLYYRLKVLDAHVPPLRERRGDLALLVEHFLARSHRPGAAVPVVSPAAWAALEHYAFPGNVRELEHAIEHAVVFARGGEIGVEHLPSELAGAAGPPRDRDGAMRTLAQAAHEFEREYLLRALLVADGKKARTAEALGISRKNLWEKLRSHGISAAGGARDSE